jgi:hypothetical protein
MNHRLLLEVAVHEAGHCVIARVVGLPGGEATIRDGNAYAHWKTDGTVRHAIALLAGRAASDELIGRTTASGLACATASLASPCAVAPCSPMRAG